MTEAKQTDIGVVFTQSDEGDEVTIFMKSLNGDRIEVEEVLRVLAALDIKAAMAQIAKDRMNSHPMPKGVM